MWWRCTTLHHTVDTAGSDGSLSCVMKCILEADHFFYLMPKSRRSKVLRLKKILSRRIYINVLSVLDDDCEGFGDFHTANRISVLCRGFLHVYNKFNSRFNCEVWIK
jgi:hypothetical protein